MVNAGATNLKVPKNLRTNEQTPERNKNQGYVECGGFLVAVDRFELSTPRI